MCLLLTEIINWPTDIEIVFLEGIIWDLNITNHRRLGISVPFADDWKLIYHMDFRT